MSVLLAVGAALACGPPAAVVDQMVARRAPAIPVMAVEGPAPVAAAAALTGAVVPAAGAVVPAAGVVPATTGAVAAGPAAGGGGTGRRRVRVLPSRLPLVVAAAAGLGAAVAAHAGATWLLPAQLAVVAGLVALAAGDVEWLLLPKAAVWPLAAAVAAAVAVGAAVTGAWPRVATAVVATAVLGAGLAAISLINPRWLGFGDVRLAVPIGLALGWSGGASEILAGFFLTNVAAGLAAVALLAARRTDTALPYGLFLAAGTVATLLIR